LHWNRLDSVGHARQSAKQLYQSRIDPLGDRPVGAQQFVWIAVIEVRIGAQELQEFGKASLELSTAEDLFHLTADAQHFALTDGMNLVRRQVGRRELAGFESVQLAAAWELPDANIVQAGRQVFVLEESLHPPIGRDNVFSNGSTGLLAQSALIGSSDRCGKLLKRFEERALCRIVDNLSLDLSGNALHDDLGMYHAGPDAGPHQLDRLVHVAWKRVQTSDPVLVVLQTLEGQFICQGIGVLDAATLIQRKQIPAILVLLHIRCVLLPKQPVVQLIG